MGGILTLGAVSAPGVFQFLRAHEAETLAPQLFGVLLARFAFVALVCGALALCTWLMEGLIAKPTERSQVLWRLQGACVLLMLGLALYLQFGALPELLRDQMAVIQESIESGVALSARGIEGKSVMRLHYDAVHQNYTRLTMIIFWLGAASLAAFAWRLSLPEKNARITE